MDKFFNNNTFVIDEKVQVLTFSNGYKVSNAEGKQIGFIKENIPGSRLLLQLLFSKHNLPMTLEVHGADGSVVASLTRGWTLFMSKVKVLNENGQQVATIKQKFGLKPKFEIYDNNENKIADIQGDWKAWNFNITDASGAQIGSVSKKWTGLARELFTDADKYVVNLDESVTGEAQRISIVSMASVIDMILKERG